LGFGGDGHIVFSYGRLVAIVSDWAERAVKKDRKGVGSLFT
jgi:hypothetical protein